MVTLIETTEELILSRSKEQGVIGFVPTMGNLHAGHISLLEQALNDSPTVYFSIFVNPKQFGPNEDFNRYPRTLKEDLNLIKVSQRKFPNCRVIVYAPRDVQQVFPKNGQTITVVGLNNILEGAIRPGHFDGVTTVVNRLFGLVKPSRAYFGQKDYQQLIVIKQMVKDLMLPVEIIGMPTIRENNGLALSSRNQFLNSDQKDEALVLSSSLNELKSLISGKKERLKAALERVKEMKKDTHWNYLELRDAETLDEDIEKSTKVVLLGVYQLGSTRLLDNLLVELQ